MWHVVTGVICDKLFCHSIDSIRSKSYSLCMDSWKATVILVKCSAGFVVTLWTVCQGFVIT